MDVHHEINGTSFIWTVAKERANLRKQEGNFESAVQVFFEPFTALTVASRNG